MIYFNEKRKKFKVAIKENSLKNAFIAIIEGYEPNKKEDLQLFELIDNNDLFETMNELVKEGKKIPDRYLALSSIYFNAKYFWEVGAGVREKENTQYPYLTHCYEEKIEEKPYQRILFLEWRRLFEDMVKEKTIYRSKKNKSMFYHWPHEYEEYVIERTAHTFKDFMFSQATKQEVLEVMSLCKKYPKVPSAKTEFEKLYNKLNSRYYNVQYLSSWLSKNALPLVTQKVQVINVNIPLVSQGLIQELKLIYEEVNENKNLLEPQDTLMVEKLYEKRVPELLNAYKNCNTKKFSNITNYENKNADELLYESLKEIHDMFESFNEKINNKKIENLSFNVRLTKEFIKHNF